MGLLIRNGQVVVQGGSAIVGIATSLCCTCCTPGCWTLAMPTWIMRLAPATTQEAGKGTKLINNLTAFIRKRILPNTPYITEVYTTFLVSPIPTANIFVQLNQAAIVCPEEAPSARVLLVGFDREASWRAAAGGSSNTIRMRVTDSDLTETLYSPYDFTIKTIAMPNINGGLAPTAYTGVTAVLEIFNGFSWLQISDSSSVYVDYSMYDCADLPVP